MTTTLAIRRRLAELEAALAQIARPASVAEMTWLKWTTNAELDEMETLFGNLQDYNDLPDLARLRVIEVVAAATRREMMAAAAKARGEPHSRIFASGLETKETAAHRRFVAACRVVSDGAMVTPGI